MLGRERRRGHPAVPDDLRSDALQELDLTLRTVEDHEVRVAMTVYEAGRNSSSTYVYCLPTPAARPADSGNDAVLCSHVPEEPGVARAIHEAPICQDEI